MRRFWALPRLVELSATGDFKLLGSGVGVAAGTTLSFVMTRKT